MTTVLITGVSGFVGPYCVKEFENAGARVLGFDREKSAVCPTTVGDIRKYEDVYRAIEEARPNVIVHLAGLSSVPESWKRPKEAFEVNVNGTRHLLEATRQLPQCPRILVVGSGELYGETRKSGAREADPIGGDSPYAQSRIEQERLIQSIDDLDVVVARSFNHTGPGQPPPFVIPYFASEIASIERGEREPILHVGNLEPQRDFSDVRDVVRAYRLLCEKGRKGELYNVCSGIPRKIQEVLKMILALSRVSIAVEPDRALFRPVDCPIRYGDPSKIQRVTGWKPVIPFEQTLADTLEYWRTPR